MAAATAEELVDIPQDTPPPTFLQSPLGKNFLRGGGIAAVLALMLGIWLWSQRTEYGILFTNVSDKDGGAIMASLDQMAVPYKFSDGGASIMVPNEQVHAIRLKLAAQGLPKGGTVGFELMENQKLGVSQFHEQINYQRSLEGELARSIESIAAVSSARVHLALPKPSVFVREQQKPTASVLLNLQTGRVIDQAQVNAIVHLLASSVSELPVSNVTVVDQNGNLLSDPDKSGNARKLDPNQLKYVEAVQKNIIKQVESLITPLVGPGNVRAEATADIDFAQVDTAAEVYKPNSPPEPQSIRSQQTSEANGPGTANPSGVPGALSNQPPGLATAPLSATGAPATAPLASTGPTRKDTTTNFEVDKTVRYEQRPMGLVKRLTVGVLVNHRRSVDAKTGRVTVTPLSPDLVAKINELVKQAMGYSKERGDTLNVTNAAFDGVDKPDLPVATLDWWRDPANLPLAKDVAKYLFVFAVIAFLYFRLLRPMLRPVLTKFDKAHELPPEPVPTAEEKAEEAASAEAAQQEAEAQAESQQDHSYRANLALAKKLAQEDPRIVANVIKAWVGTNE
ncbi:flagellar basal-body MS-ring/collar protein FliF [Massilia antarctica]|uniref:flagellar basal-body MS-ring/collar protein FliF n=1 Tax=Massilia antarctica TaxID=2765360 RepID=UPI0006BB6A00|nr:flagellar basal-body MS-ring/collar protein FliF [Massilia sp. H27-R4]MCY0911405.1 flagellar basal-body MS-ring/collar protein FliF [Massilia sp. H27-R4]CUI04992.1 Flagellar M-ring protein FliF [Janthinobacterium sp. CG23_2]CUU28778.1 Flagellar M-ring protein FliF [Janthinobacterium sp. CG23_2]